MALSLLQDAQTRGLAAALAGIKKEEDRSFSMSPQMTNSSSHIYSGIHPAAASALSMLSPSSILAANRTAAALMAARLPMSTLASMSSLFPHHPALFGAWHQTGQSTIDNKLTTTGPHSPPESPVSPVINAKILAHNNNNNNNNNNNHNFNNNNNNSNNNNNIVSTTIEIPTKKARKSNSKKELKQDFISPPIEIPTHNDMFSPGPISPPSSGSSPNSTNTEGSALHGTVKDPTRDKCFTCKICNRSFGYKHVLQNHERTHTGEKPFECPECHKRFTRDHHLKTHMRLHTGEKPYHCSHCDRQFVQVANLRRHLRVHTGERPYTCDMCDARFSDSNQLKSHLLIHNGEKPFECDHCHLKFRRRHHLVHHKCGIQGPPTPAISPAMSDIALYEHQNKIHSANSFNSFDNNSNDNNSKQSHFISTTMISSISPSISTLPPPSYDMHDDNTDNDVPLDLSEENTISNSTTPLSTINDGDKQRSRKSTDIRRVLRLPKQILHMPTELPEQTEPEDLSMHSPRSRISSSLHSPISSHHDIDDLEDLDEAATLYMKNHQHPNHQQHQEHQKRLEIIIEEQQQQQQIQQRNQYHLKLPLKRHIIEQHIKHSP